jgi:uncharacterized protein (DUF983 family)
LHVTLYSPVTMGRLERHDALMHGLEMTSTPNVSPLAAALAGHCPSCGKGRLFKNVLEMRPACEACGFDNSVINVGDGAAVFAILILGIFVLGGALFVEFTYLPHWSVHVLLWGILTPLFALGLLRVLKALLIGQTYKHKAAEGRVAKD